MDNWLKVDSAAKYADVSARTFRKWLAPGGLRHVRMPSGTILVKVSWIDKYLEGFIQKASSEDVDQIVAQTVNELCIR